MPAAHVALMACQRVDEASTAVSGPLPTTCQTSRRTAGKVRSYSAEKLPLCRRNAHDMRHRHFPEVSAAFGMLTAGAPSSDQFLCNQSLRTAGLSTDRLSQLPCTCMTESRVTSSTLAFHLTSGSATTTPVRHYRNEMCSSTTGSTIVWLPRRDSRQVVLAKTDSSPTATGGGERQRLAPAAQSNGQEVGWTANAMYNEARRKRSYRVAVNLFNKNPERGLQFLIDWGFVTPTPTCVARFLITRKGLSKQRIGDYVGNIQDEFCSSVLKSIAQEIDMYTLDLDIALRRFLHHFRLPGEAQKIERVIQAFAERYCQCNPTGAGSSQKRIDTVFVLAFAIIMLNTDLHSPNVKPQKRMKLEDFIKNLRGLDEGRMINPASLADIYERIKAQEFRTGSDHVTQVLKVDRKIVGNKPTLTLPHRRLICYIRLTEVLDPRRKQSLTAHQREAFLFNDLLLLTKIVPKKKNKATYQYRESHALGGMEVNHFSTPIYPYGVRIHLAGEGRTLHFNASCAEDRRRFLEDLDEAILENGEMEALESNLRLLDEEVKQSRQKSQCNHENRDSGVPDDTVSQGGSQKCGISTSSGELCHFESPVRESMRKTTSNSSVDSGLADNVLTKGRLCRTDI